MQEYIHGKCVSADEFVILKPERQLAEGFLQISLCYYVQVMYVQKFEISSSKVILLDGTSHLCHN